MTKQPKISDNFRYVLKRHRQKIGLTQEQLSERVGISASFLGMMETGKKKPNIDMLFRLAAGLEVSASVLIAELEKEPTPVAHVD